MSPVGIPLKAKVAGIVVVGVLIFSLIGTTLEAVNQAVNQTDAEAQLTREQFVGRLDTQGGDADENPVIHTFKFVCPFH